MPPLPAEYLAVTIFSKKSAKSLNGVLLQDPHLHDHHALRDVANQNTSVPLLDGKHCGSAREQQKIRSLGRKQSHTTKKMKKMKLSQSIKPSGWSNSHMTSLILDLTKCIENSSPATRLSPSEEGLPPKQDLSFCELKQMSNMFACLDPMS